MSIKHSKFKNTYLIFEFLVRQTLTDLFTKGNIKESKAFNLIRENFHKGVLKEELLLYRALVENTIANKQTADYLIEECIKMQERLPQNELRQKKYNLIGEVKKHYDIHKMFSTEVPEYNDAGAVYMLFEAHNKQNILKKSRYMGTICENIMKPKKPKKSKKIFECIKSASKDERELAYKVLVESFNNKFTDSLNDAQRKYIQDFMYSSTNENGWIQEHVRNVRNDIKKHQRRLGSRKDNNDKVLSMKLDECKKKLDSIAEKRIFEDEDHSKMITLYQLTELLNKYESER